MNHALTGQKETQPELSVESDPEPESEPVFVEPLSPFEPLTAAPASRASLDDYFDRLSTAFEHASGPSSRMFQPLPDRSQDLALPIPQPPPAATPPPAVEWPAHEWLSPGGTAFTFERRGEETNPILEAVTALMAQGPENGSTRAVPSARGDAPVVAPPTAAPSPEMVEAVAERVLAKLAPEVAQSLRRLVVQEIARSQHDVR